MDPETILKDLVTSSHQSDARLVVAVARFDQQSLSTLYERHGAAVFALANRLLRRRDLAEEVTQEIFVRLWTRPDRFDPDRGSLRSFLLADTHGRSIDLLRAEVARRNREEREGRLEPAAVATLEQEVIANVTSETIRAALERLNEGQRAAITLAYFGGYSYREVAGALGEPEGTIKSRIRLGLNRLRGELTEAGVFA